METVKSTIEATKLLDYNINGKQWLCPKRYKLPDGVSLAEGENLIYVIEDNNKHRIWLTDKKIIFQDESLWGIYLEDIKTIRFYNDEDYYEIHINDYWIDLDLMISQEFYDLLVGCLEVSVMHFVYPEYYNFWNSIRQNFFASEYDYKEELEIIKGNNLFRLRAVLGNITYCYSKEKYKETLERLSEYDGILKEYNENEANDFLSNSAQVYHLLTIPDIDLRDHIEIVRGLCLGEIDDYIGAYNAFCEAYTRIDNVESRNQLIECIKYCNKNINNDFTSIPYNNRKYVVIDSGFYDVPSDSIRVLHPDYMPNIEFPLSHPQKGVLYIGHPFNPNIYMPISSYEEVLFHDRYQELSYFLQCLGATRIEIQINYNNSRIFSRDTIKQNEADGSFKLIGGNVTSINEKNHVGNNESNSNFSRLQEFAPSKLPYIPKDVIWYPNESSWQRLFQQRKEGTLLTHEEVISSEQIQVISKRDIEEISASLNIILFGGKGDHLKEIKSELIEKEKTEWVLKVHFAPLSELSNSEIVKQNNNMLIDSKLCVEENEQEYINELEVMYESGRGEIQRDERRILNRLRCKLAISETRAKALEKEVIEKHCLVGNELEYLEEVEFCLENDGTISAAERRMLERQRNKLGISDYRAFEIEGLLSNIEVCKEDNSFKENELNFLEEIRRQLEDDQKLYDIDAKTLFYTRKKYNISKKRVKEMENILS